jgi:hypothetical protein
MASTIIHLCIAKEINEKLKRNKAQLYLGTVAPDISKIMGAGRTVTHFGSENRSDVPDMRSFLTSYSSNLDNDFVMGYFIHLYTDYLWTKYFLPDFIKNNNVTTLKGDKVRIPPEMVGDWIYNDHTDLNMLLLDKYSLDLSLFYNEVPKVDLIIKEIDYSKLNLLVDKLGLIIKNSYQTKMYNFDITGVSRFIMFASEVIYSSIEELEK